MVFDGLGDKRLEDLNLATMIAVAVSVRIRRSKGLTPNGCAATVRPMAIEAVVPIANDITILQKHAMKDRLGDIEVARVAPIQDRSASGPSTVVPTSGLAARWVSARCKRHQHSETSAEILERTNKMVRQHRVYGPGMFDEPCHAK